MNRLAGWGLAWWDPRRLLKPLTHVAMRFMHWISPNRATSPELENIVERGYPFLDHIWLGGREQSWYLENLAVHPDFQKKGQGRALVAWGLEQAKKEGIACSVIAADGKEKFYQACGFNVGPVGRAGEGEGNPMHDVDGGLIFFRDKDGVVVEKRNQEFGWKEREYLIGRVVEKECWRTRGVEVVISLSVIV